MRLKLKTNQKLSLGLRTALLILIAVAGLLCMLFFLQRKPQAEVYTQTFDSGSRDTEAGNCWVFQGFSIRTTDDGTGSRISGNGSLRSPQLTNPSGPSGLTSPCTALTGTGDLKFSHYNHNFSGGARRFLQVVLIDNNDLSRDTIWSHEYTSTSVQNTVVPITHTGNYRILWQAWGSNGNSRVWMDDIEIPGESIAALASAGGDCSCTASSLPVTLTSFSANWRQQVAHIEWTTSMEFHSSHFEVERSIDGELFESIGEVVAAGVSNEPRVYAFSDRQAAALGDRVMYRLRQVDLDGSFMYSQQVELFAPGKSEQLSVEKVYPNPVTGPVTFEVFVPSPGPVEFEIIDLSGRIAESGKIESAAGIQAFMLDLSTHPAGKYIFRVRQGRQVKTGLIDRR